MTDFQVKKCAKRVEFKDLDRISQLPEPIIVYILSFLSTEEAARTSVLSKEWRWRWLFGDEFDFNTSRLIKPQDLELGGTRTTLDVSVLGRLFSEWVSTVLESRSVHVEEASRISRLRFQFPLELDRCYREKIDEWLIYAFAKRVQSLELDLSLYSNPRYDGYYFPRRFLAEPETDFSFLRSLSLLGVSVSREHIDLFLLRFRSLEHLKVCGSCLLQSVEIGSSSSALKHVEIINCSLLSVVICGSSLVSLAFTSSQKLVLENNPGLVSVCVSGLPRHDFFRQHGDDGAQLQMLSGCLSTLQILTLDLNYSNDDENLDQVPKLAELKQLTLIVDPDLKASLVRLTTLLGLSPKLEKLVLEFLSLPSVRVWKKKASKKGPFSLHELRVIEVCGYNGRSEAEDKLLKCVFEHIVAPLERIIFNPRMVRTPDCSFPYNVPRTETSVEKRVELFKGVVEMGAKKFKRAKKKVMSSPVEFIVKNSASTEPCLFV